MTARRPLQPLSPVSPNIIPTDYTYIPKKAGANLHGPYAMDERVQDDVTQGSGSIASGLTSLENDTDDFGRLMIQDARDERRLHDALRGNVQAFRKARPQPRVGLTLENLERNNGLNNGGQVFNGSSHYESPASVSSGSSDPAVRPPQEWGRKGRVRRDWLKRITSDEDSNVKGEGANPDLVYSRRTVFAGDETPRQQDWGALAAEDRPLPSIEDSPLSHRNSNAGTPFGLRNNLVEDSDTSVELSFNNASLIASTPYVPRSTKLDDIRQREIDSLKEQAVASSRLDRIRQTSPEETRRPRSSSHAPLTSMANGESLSRQVPEDNAQLQARKRTNSSRSLGKSPIGNTDGADAARNSPIVVYKSSETVGIVDHGIQANAQTSPQRPRHRREDSHDLLRRLARVSSVSASPSPGRAGIPRPQTAPPATSTDAAPPSKETYDAKTDGRSSAPPQAGPPVHPEKDDPMDEEPRRRDAAVEAERRDKPALQLTQQPEDVDVTPMPKDRPPIDAKTPVVTGAWIETPAPQTSRRTFVNFSNTSTTQRRRSPSKRDGSPSKNSPTKSKSFTAEEAREAQTPRSEPQKPSLPGSALEAIVEEARSKQNEPGDNDAYGEATINSLEDIIIPGTEHTETVDPDDDTLRGLELPTGPPKDERERQRQQEVLQLHSMNRKLKNMRTGIRDSERGINRLTKDVETSMNENEGPRANQAQCPCVEKGHWTSLMTSARTYIKSKLYDGNTSWWRRGITWWSVLLTVLLGYLLLEYLLCWRYCHKQYAEYMIGFGVDPKAPRYLGEAVPTVLFHPSHFIWRPLLNAFRYFWANMFGVFASDEMARESVSRTAQWTTRVITQAQETLDDFSMNNDESI